MNLLIHKKLLPKSFEVPSFMAEFGVIASPKKLETIDFPGISSTIYNNLCRNLCRTILNRFCHKVFFLLHFFVLTGIFKAQAQQTVNYALYANIIYRFTKYINWPDDKKSGDFVIGIVGDSPLYDEIRNFTNNKKVSNQKIVIKTFSTSSPSYKCHILFISDSESRSAKRIAAITEGISTLIITESDGLARKGSCINFIIADEHLKLEINKNNIEQRNLTVASEFFGFGTIIK